MFVQQQWLQQIATLIPIDHLKLWLVDHNSVMDRPKLVEDEAVGQSLGTEVICIEPLMVPEPSVSTGAEKSGTFTAHMLIQLR
jgi:hypothetical protein